MKIDKKDLRLILSYGKQYMNTLNLPLFVSREEVERGEIPTIAILEASIMYLNSKGLLKESVELDYTNDYDDNDSIDLPERE
jgi:hypothetical protein